ncbi:AAA family ATPase [Actinocorallia sp. A-T 12471]|uniref:AAA family ATPase n=1 Tax=Actinocorallia sp. A-T 12471 TaxID=3089813 RepID=UPI0029CAD7DA|nr:AAA family ATPase [Actinocorallia sp. A-T 12471]MDX6741438.1 AAA family ATPase [Actinocorallia sp. A-T 12471]
MYLARLGLRGFRSFDDSVVHLREGVTVLLGENNRGKSNVMDAVRLVPAPLDGKKDLYFDGSGLHRGGGQRRLTISATYEPPWSGRQRGTTSWQAGLVKTSDADPEPEARRRIRHLYLPPLRDTQWELASRQGGVIERLLREPE